MSQLRIALAQVNSCVGDLEGNARAVVDWTRKAADGGAHLVVFPEMHLTGYPVEDLALRESFAHASQRALDTPAARLPAPRRGAVATRGGAAPALVGSLALDDVAPRDSAAVLYRGEVVARQHKHHLPNYGVFDERRYFKSGQRLDIIRLHGLEVGMVICAD